MKIIFEKATENHADPQWRKWFAWRPVRIKPGVWVWLQSVERKVSWEDYGWDNYKKVEYRELGAADVVTEE